MVEWVTLFEELIKRKVSTVCKIFICPKTFFTSFRLFVYCFRGLALTFSSIMMRKRRRKRKRSRKKIKRSKRMGKKDWRMKRRR